MGLTGGGGLLWCGGHERGVRPSLGQVLQGWSGRDTGETFFKYNQPPLFIV